MTWRLAAQFADELNLDGPTVENVRDWLPIIRERCEEIGRDPDTLLVTAQMWWDRPGTQERSRVEQLAELRELGLSLVFSDFSRESQTDVAFHSFAADCRTAGLELD